MNPKSTPEPQIDWAPLRQAVKDMERSIRVLANANALLTEAEALVARLSEVERDMPEGDFADQYEGHVTPPLARLRGVIARIDGEAAR